jgi:Coenzyme PQQ synthesis protein D (PqqD)
MYKLSASVRSTHGQDGAVVLDVRQGKMFNLNVVGSRILELLKGRYSESAIITEIGREFKVSREVAAHDVQEFIEALKQHALLEGPGANDQHSLGARS